MKSVWKLASAVALAMAAAAQPAHSAIEYSFTNNADLSFTYLTNSFVTSYTDIFRGDPKLTQSSGVFQDVQFCPIGTPSGVCKISPGGATTTNQILFVVTQGSFMSVGREADFGPTDFTTLGVHASALYNMQATLTVRDTNAPLPEPTTWAMFIAGFGLVGSVMRNRRVSVCFV